MAWDKGFNFRQNAGFVTDGTDETYVLSAETYPTTRNGATFGWSTAPTGRADRNAAVDRRLAGIHFQGNSGTQITFRVDLNSATTYDISLAMGDEGFAQGYQYCQFLDDTTVKRTIDDTGGTAAANFDDATGVNRALADWPGSNVADSQTFSTTTFYLRVGSPSAQSNSTTIAHLFLSEVAGGSTILPLLNAYHG